MVSKRVTNKEILAEIKKNNTYTIILSIFFFVFALTISFLNLYFTYPSPLFFSLLIGAFIITFLVSGAMLGHAISEFFGGFYKKKEKSKK